MMKLKFNGAQGQKTSGCPCHGKRSVSGVVYSRDFVLPSTGKFKTFRTGTTYEVSDRDGEFLLSMNFTKDGVVMPSFTRV